MISSKNGLSEMIDYTVKHTRGHRIMRLFGNLYKALNGQSLLSIGELGVNTCAERITFINAT